MKHHDGNELPRLRLVPLEADDGERREADDEAMAFALPADPIRPLAAEVADVAAAVGLGVGVEDFFIPAFARHSYPVAFADDGGGVDDEDEDLASAAAAQEGDDGVVGVVEVDPLEAGVGVVLIVEGGLVAVEPIEM